MSWPPLSERARQCRPCTPPWPRPSRALTSTQHPKSPREIFQGIPQEIPQEIPQGIPQGIAQGIPQGIPQGPITQGIPPKIRFLINQQSLKPTFLVISDHFCPQVERWGLEPMGSYSYVLRMKSRGGGGRGVPALWPTK